MLCQRRNYDIEKELRCIAYHGIDHYKHMYIKIVGMITYVLDST